MAVTTHSEVDSECTPRPSQRVTPGGTRPTQASAPADISWITDNPVSLAAKCAAVAEDRNGGTQNSTVAGSDGSGSSGPVSTSTVTPSGRVPSRPRPASCAIHTFPRTDDTAAAEPGPAGPRQGCWLRRNPAPPALPDVAFRGARLRQNPAPPALPGGTGLLSRAG